MGVLALGRHHLLPGPWLEEYDAIGLTPGALFMLAVVLACVKPPRRRGRAAEGAMARLTSARATLAAATIVAGVLGSISWTPIYPSSNMCNITLDSQILESSSGKKYGQIKTPVLSGPVYCWYIFRGELGARIEIQVYRMVRSGKWKNGCTGGGLTFLPGTRLNASSETSLKVCGENSRFSPPVTLLLDTDRAVLEYRVLERSERSLFMAFFSFSPRNSPHVGVRSRGGRPVPHTECDWLYQDTDCALKDSCVLASPGYPGQSGGPPSTAVKPPRRRGRAAEGAMARLTPPPRHFGRGETIVAGVLGSISWTTPIYPYQQQ
ncbi:uncharacterized protein LOC119094958 [Pollicipes pollicipes]|uniref:uncharacterized protein LOC119094958 n=1 Tax=Pollicipes pollicipes TaxID=41117 RepID=UPI0018853B6C|nr:uncharacterized protein LOC119094958 [Pollicipes pollicipes]